MPPGKLDKTYASSLILAYSLHYVKTWCHSQNHKHITYCTAVSGGCLVRRLPIPFSIKIGYTGPRSWVENYFHQVKVGQRCSNLPTWLPFWFSDDPKWERIRKASKVHISYYASAYHRVETNQQPHHLFISVMWYQSINKSINWFIYISAEKLN